MGHCGFDGITYGIPEHPVINEPTTLQPFQCKRLYEDRILEFDGKELMINDLNSFAVEIGMFGTSRKSDGSCTNAGLFEVRGKEYPSNYLMATISGRVTRRKVTYDPSLGLVNLEGHPVPVRRSSYIGDLSTFLWEIQSSNCRDLIQEVYKDRGTLITPQNKNLHRQVIVQNEKRGITFALDLQRSCEMCGYQTFQTQLNNVYISISEDNFVPGVDPTRYVDRLDNIIGILFSRGSDSTFTDVHHL